MNKNNKIHLKVSERKVLLRIFDVFFVFAAFYSVGHFLDFEYFKESIHSYFSLLAIALYLNCIGTVFEMYNIQVASNLFQVLRSTILTVSTTFLIYLFTTVCSTELPNSKLQIVFFYFTLLLSLVIWRVFYIKFLASNRFVQNVLLVCNGNQLEDLILDLEKSDPHYKVVAYVNSERTKNDVLQYHYVQNVAIDDLVSFVNQNKLFEIIIASQNTEDISANLYRKLLHLLESGNTIREYTQVYEDKTQRIPIQHINRDFYKFLPFNRNNSNQLYLVHVRIMDTLISIVGVLIGFLLIPLIALGNLIGNRGKLFFIQERIGKNGEIFHIFKFRTMIKNTVIEGDAFSSSGDARITSFGKFLRKTRIDEIPQFVNILKGQMSVIGPRPDVPWFVKEISDLTPFYGTRHVIKPGITGWAQVNYSYGESMEESLIKLQYDLYYIKHRSIFLDLKITIKTFSTILFYRGE
jgi:exopolysaccharide biosynthesis polyprenyl glycosylphosphotransferase